MRTRLRALVVASLALGVGIAGCRRSTSPVLDAAPPAATTPPGPVTAVMPDAGPAEPLPRGIDETGLLDHDDLAAELGLTDGESLSGFSGVEADLSDLEDIGHGSSSAGFMEELGDFEESATEGDGSRSSSED